MDQLPTINWDDLKQQQDAAAAQKQKLAAIGGIGDSLANQQSFGNFYLGEMNPHQDVSSTTDKIAANIPDPVARTKQNIDAQADFYKSNLANQTAQVDSKMLRDALDPVSEISNSKREFAKAGLAAMDSAKMFKNKPEILTNLSKAIDGMSGYQVDKLLADMPFLKTAAEASRTQMMDIGNQLRAQGIALQGQRLDLQKDNQVNQAAAAFDKDPLLQSSTRQLNQIQIDKHTLQASNMITPQMLAEISKGIGVALNQGKATGMHETEMQSLATSQTDIANLIQRLTNKPQDGASKEVRQQAIETLARLEDAYNQARARRAKELTVGRSYTNQRAQEAMQTKAASYDIPMDQNSEAPSLQMKSADAAPPAMTATPEDLAMLKIVKDRLKANPKDSKAQDVYRVLQSKGLQ